MTPFAITGVQMHVAAIHSNVEAMRQRFRPEMTQQQFSRFAASLIDGSLDNWRTGAYDCYQRCCLGIL